QDREELLRFIDTRAANAWTTGTTDAKAAERKKAFHEAIAFFEKVASAWGLEPYVSEAKAEVKRLKKAAEENRAKIEKEQRERDKQRCRDAETRALEHASKTFDFHAALQEVRKILPGQPGADPVQTEEARTAAKALERDYEHLVALKNRMIGEAKNKAGKVKIRRNGREVVVHGADRDGITITLGGAQTSTLWGKFSLKEFFEAALRLLEPPSPDDRLRLGVFALVLGLADRCEQQLNYAKKDGRPDVKKAAEAYIRRLYSGHGQAGRELEARAKAKYQEIINLYWQSKREEDHGKAYGLLRKALDLFEEWVEEFGQTQFVKEKQKKK
ncbi:MAG: hypothetical protein ACYTHN_16915, partial [Planctomycetota bacterium]